jgi:hypothetical protein
MRSWNVPKVVVNSCFGGFGISEAGMLRYAELKGIRLYPEKNQFHMMTYYTVPPEQRVDQLTAEQWLGATSEQRMAHNDAYDAQTLHYDDINRDDPLLVQVVEELGTEAADRFSELRIAYVPDDVKWTIEEYDGKEWVAEVHRTW